MKQLFSSIIVLLLISISAQATQTNRQECEQDQGSEWVGDTHTNRQGQEYESGIDGVCEGETESTECSRATKRGDCYSG